MKPIVFLFCWFTINSLIAQSDYTKGYIITVKNDTLFGEIKMNTKNDMEVYSKIAFREKNPGATKQFIPAKIHGYAFDASEYASVRLEQQWVFMQIICKGKVMFFEYKPPVSLGNERKQSQYFMARGGFDGMSQIFVDGKIKKQLKGFMADDKELMKEIEGQDLDYSGLLRVIETFNERNK